MSEIIIGNNVINDTQNLICIHGSILINLNFFKYFHIFLEVILNFFITMQVLLPVHGRCARRSKLSSLYLN